MMSTKVKTLSFTIAEMSEKINFLWGPHFKVTHEHQNGRNVHYLPKIIPQPPIR